jgi:hypothetical protein
MNAKTVFVVGAGASKEYGFPLGGDLIDQIAVKLDFKMDDFHMISKIDSTIHNAYPALAMENYRNNDINPYLRAAKTIVGAMPQSISIDNFIDTHRGNKDIEMCGKLGIALCILNAEAKSSLRVGRVDGDKLDFKKLKQTWITSFFKLLSENCQIDDIKERLSKVAFIVFNYDRCIEHYLYYALQSYYAITPKQAAELVNTIEIYHPYGSLGKLRWQDRNGGVSFGEDVASHDLVRIIGRLKTFTEEMESVEIGILRKQLAEASKIIFLGFAYHQQNLDLLLGNEGGEYRPLRMYGTAFGISDSDLSIIQGVLNGYVGGADNSCLKKVLCNDLFSEFWRTFSLAR